MTDWASFNLIGAAPRFRALLELLPTWAAVDATVLLCGETGTGKELVARALHYLSARRGGPFVPINCGAIPDTMIESELFGHVRGAFTDASRDHRGVIAQADGGTLFLDEVDALSLRGQAAILRFAQDRSYRPLGGSRAERSNVRLVAATNADLERLCREGRFRRDLLYRLNLLNIGLPPLRERDGDVLLLAQAFVERFRQQYRCAARRLEPASIEPLASYDWPGNVRELEHLVHRCFLLAEDERVVLRLPGAEPAAAAALPDGAPPSLPFASAKARAIAEFERNYVIELLAATRGNLSHAARLAGKERRCFGKLVRKYGLERADFDPTPAGPAA